VKEVELLLRRGELEVDSRFVDRIRGVYSDSHYAQWTSEPPDYAGYVMGHAILVFRGVDWLVLETDAEKDEEPSPCGCSYHFPRKSAGANVPAEIRLMVKTRTWLSRPLTVSVSVVALVEGSDD